MEWCYDGDQLTYNTLGFIQATEKPGNFDKISNLAYKSRNICNIHHEVLWSYFLIYRFLIFCEQWATLAQKLGKNMQYLWEIKQFLS